MSVVAYDVNTFLKLHVFLKEFARILPKECDFFTNFAKLFESDSSITLAKI